MEIAVDREFSGWISISLTKLVKFSSCSFRSEEISNDVLPGGRIEGDVRTPIVAFTCNASSSSEARYSALARFTPSLTNAAIAITLPINPITSAMVMLSGARSCGHLKLRTV